MNILAVIPAHNESKAIALLVAAVKEMGHNILVIDDGSTDATADLAKAAGAVVLSVPKKSGKGNALRLGFDYAIKNNYAAVITLDGDGQHDASDIRFFIECFQKTGAAVINGNRMADPKGMPLLRLATNALMSWLISNVCRQSVPDTQCGFRFITVEVLKNIQLESSEFEIETEFLVKASKKGFKFLSVPIKTIYRDEVSKIKPVKDTVKFIRYMIAESVKP